MSTMKFKRAVSRIQALRSAKGGYGVEIIGALGVLMLLVGWGLYEQSKVSDQNTAKIAATHHATVTTAAIAYVKDHYSELLAAAPSVGSRTTVSFATLQANRYVQPSLSSTNIWGQTLNLRITRMSLDPKTVQLDAILIGEGGQNAPEGVARQVAQHIGAEGGYTVAAGGYCGPNKVSVSTLCGTRGVWERPVADFGTAVPPGHIASALFFKDGMAVNDYLYRNRVPGKPELNTMQTYLQMGAGTRAAEGQACYSVAGDSTSPLLQNGAIGTTVDGLILSCQSGVWRPQSPTIAKSWYSADSAGSGRTTTMGVHKFCALTYSWYAWKEQAGGCYIYQSGITYYLQAKGDPSVSSGTGVTCQATCFD